MAITCRAIKAILTEYPRAAARSSIHAEAIKERPSTRRPCSRRAATSSRPRRCRRSGATAPGSRPRPRRRRSWPRSWPRPPGSATPQATLAAFATLGKDGCGGCHETFRKKTVLSPACGWAALSGAGDRCSRRWRRPAPPMPAPLARGELMFNIGGCTNCHTAKDGAAARRRRRDREPLRRLLRAQHHARPRDRHRRLERGRLHPGDARGPRPGRLAATTRPSPTPPTPG